MYQALLLERELSIMSLDAGTKMESLIISVKDILLDTASSVSEKDHRFDQLNYNPTSSSNKSIQRLLIIDDLDVIIPDADETETSSASTYTNLEAEQLRALNTVVKLVDSANNSSLCNSVVVGIARAPLAQLPTQLARVGRLEKEVVMAPPSLGQRKDIFQFWLSTLPTKKSKQQSVIIEWANLLAPRTAGCVASDIRRICADALTSAIARESKSAELTMPIDNLLQNVNVEWSDVKQAARSCVPSQLASMDVIPAKLGDFQGSDMRQVDAKAEFEWAWKDFGGYSDIKTRIFRTIVRPWRYHIMESKPQDSSAASSLLDDILGSSRPAGVLFHGPSGNGKTYAAMCLASSLGLNCVKVRLSMFCSVLY